MAYGPLSQSELIRRGLAAAKTRGVRLGNRTNLPEAQEKGRAAIQAASAAFAANVLPVISQIQAGGATSLAAIAGALNERHVPAPRGGTWYPSTVRNVLMSAVVAGSRTQKP